MRLSYSRSDYYAVVFDQKVETWIKCHINAFNHFGGIPNVIKLDNLKSGVLDAKFYEPIYQKQYKAMADYYGCFLSPCRPYQPQEKGKVENGIKYVKNNFFAGRKFANYQALSSELDNWIEVTSDRIHGTTKKKPSEVFADEELSSLIKLPATDFDMSKWCIRKVQKDCHIILNNSYYSVPAKYVSQEVEVVSTEKLVKIYDNDENIATHRRSSIPGEFVTQESHYAKNKLYCPGFASYDEKYKESLSNIGLSGKEFLLYLQETKKRDWYRTARGVVSLKRHYSDEAIDKSLKRALNYGICSYSKILSILQNNCYDLPLLERGTSCKN
jgi:hypothetical protein